jgi:hypothetical protein
MVDTCSLGGLSACVEARALYEMVVRGTASVEELRALIAVDSESEAWLLAFAKANPEDARWIESSLKFRQAVAREFEKLLMGGAVPADVEAKEIELAPPSEAEEIACAK